MRRRVSFVPTTALAVTLLCLFTATRADSQTFPADGQWIAVTRDGSVVTDPVGDATGSRDVVGDALNAAAYYAGDGTYMFLRLRLNVSPLQTPTTLQSFAWGAVLDTDGVPTTYELFVNVNGISNPDAVELSGNTITGTPDTPTDPTEVLLSTYSTTTFARVVPAPTSFDTTPDYFIDLALPMSALASAGVSSATPMRLAFGSSTSVSALTADFASTTSALTLTGLLSDPLVCGPSGCAPLVCSAGMYSPTGSEPCEDCPTGTYSSLPGSMSCSFCDAGFVAPSTGSMFCNACPEGTQMPFSGGVACETCPEGYIAPFTGTALCTQCPAGTTSDPTHTMCVATTPCPVGRHSPTGNEPCEKCLPGTYAENLGSIVCNSCAAGTVAPLAGSEFCDRCPVGTQMPIEGGIACETCPEGYIAPDIGTALCTQCPSGKTSDPTHTMCIPILGAPMGVVPEVSFLGAAHPNPARNSTTFEFGLAKPGALRLSVHDAAGRLVFALAGGDRAPGTYRIAWDLKSGSGKRVAPGVYYCRMECGAFRAMRTVLVTR